MFVTMNLVAQRGHGYRSPVGARGGTSVARVGAMAAGVSYASINARVINNDHYRDATDEAEGAPAVNADQCQVCIKDLFKKHFLLETF